MLRGNRSAPVSPAASTRANREAETAVQNLDRIQKAVADIDTALNMPTPHLPPMQLRGWNEQTAWLRGVRTRLGEAAQRIKQKATFGTKLGGFTKGVASMGLNVAGAAIPGGNVLNNALGGAFGSNLAGGGGRQEGTTANTTGGSMVAEMAAMNMQFLALQNAVQMESRKFQTLSNASKARHDIAMRSISNTRA
jgi:hypothetical protein